jgi:anti-sigma-K factor RskA
MFVAAYDPDRKALIITSLAPAGADSAHVHELWLIPADGKPRSLGIIEPGTSRRMPMARPLAPMVAEGAELAVTLEPPGGSTKDGPSGPMAAVGELSKI